MDMIRRFCEIKMDSKGKLISSNMSQSYKLFTNRYRKINRDVFLDIFRHKKLFNNHFAKYPVIYLDFKEVSGKTFYNFVSTFRNMIKELFTYHEYLLENNFIIEKEKDVFKRYYDYDKISNLNEEELKGSLQFLSKMLYIHFNKNVILLIDHFDEPIQKAIYQSNTDINKIITFMRNFIYNSLNSNKYVTRALINAFVKLYGIVTTEKMNVVPFSSNSKFSKLYGFIENDVKVLLDTFDMTESLEDVRRWYGGYKVENSTVELYNVFSVLSYLEYKKLQNYLHIGYNIVNLERVFLNKKIRNEIESVLFNNFTRISVVDKINIDHILKLKEIIDGNCKLDYKDVFLFLQYMLDVGYFTVYTRNGSSLELRIPNNEILHDIRRSRNQ